RALKKSISFNFARYLTIESSNTSLFSFILELLNVGGASDDFKPGNIPFKSVHRDLRYRRTKR
ncbi:hypothetical protein, partial [Peribacillus asahii]|uniref:hypothetical protein n=1 Tax=Peribacillus asahii TaxID=228899 RepID=UPI001C713BA4